MSMTDRVPVDISIDDIVYGIATQGSPVVSYVIQQLDLTQQDADFTMDVITQLTVSLREELSPDDMKDFLKKLRKKVK